MVTQPAKCIDGRDHPCPIHSEEAIAAQNAALAAGRSQLELPSVSVIRVTK